MPLAEGGHPGHVILGIALPFSPARPPALARKAGYVEAASDRPDRRAARRVQSILAVAHVGARYETLLALHILSFDLLLIWFPFGKLMHSILAFGSRYTTGVTFTRRGARV